MPQLSRTAARPTGDIAGGAHTLPVLPSASHTKQALPRATPEVEGQVLQLSTNPYSYNSLHVQRISLLAPASFPLRCGSSERL